MQLFHNTNYSVQCTLMLSRFDIELLITLMQMEVHVLSPIPSCLSSLTQNFRITHDARHFLRLRKPQI